MKIIIDLQNVLITLFRVLNMLYKRKSTSIFQFKKDIIILLKRHRNQRFLFLYLLL